MKNYLKIITAGSVGIITTKMMGFGSFTLLGFATFILAYLAVSLVWHLLSRDALHKTTFNLKKISIGLSILFTLFAVFAYFILWQYQQSTPYTNTLLDKYRSLNKIYSNLVQFHPLLSNHDYKKLRYQFAEYLSPYQLNNDEKEQIWKNQLKLFVLQTKIRNLLMDIDVKILDNRVSYGYEYDYAKAKVTPFYINSFITTFNNHAEGASIPSSFDKKPSKQARFKDYGGGIIRADLPYFNNSIPIHQKDIEKIKLIHKMTQLTVQILTLNNQLVLNKKISNELTTHIKP